MSLPRIHLTLEYGDNETGPTIRERSIIFGVQYELFQKPRHPPNYGIRLCPTSDQEEWSPDCLYFYAAHEGISLHFNPYHSFTRAKYVYDRGGIFGQEQISSKTHIVSVFAKSGAVVLSGEGMESMMMVVEGVEKFVKDLKEKETAKLAGMVSVLDSIIMDEFQW